MIASHFLHAYIVVQPFTEDGKNKYKVLGLSFDWIAIMIFCSLVPVFKVFGLFYLDPMVRLGHGFK